MTTRQRLEYSFMCEKLMADIRLCFTPEKPSLRDIEAQCQVNASVLSRIDNGNVPAIDTFVTLCAAFDLTPGDYFEKQVWVLQKVTE